MQCAHQQQGRPIAQRLLGDELAQLVRRLPCAAQCEEHLLVLLAGCDAPLLQTKSLALGDVEGQPGPGRTAPQCQRLVVSRQPTAVLEVPRPRQPRDEASASTPTPDMSSR